MSAHPLSNSTEKVEVLSNIISTKFQPSRCCINVLQNNSAAPTIEPEQLKTKSETYPEIQLADSPLLRAENNNNTPQLDDLVLSATSRVSYILTEIVRFNMRKAATTTISSSTPKRNSKSTTTFDCFDNSFAPSIMLNEYLERIAMQIHLEQDIIVIALHQIDRFMRTQPSFKLSPLNCHRMLLVSLMIASKMHLDIQIIACPLKLFARIGGVAEEDLFEMETRFLELISFKLFVSEDDFSAYKLKLLSMKIA